MTDYEHIKLFVSDGSLKGIKDTINVFNNGCGFLCFLAHGTPMNLKIFDSVNKKWMNILTNPSMVFLKNKNMLPICVLGSCHLQQFDVNIFNFLSELKEYRFEYLIKNAGGKLIQGQFFKYKWAPECWGWKLASKINGGAVATVGCTSYALTKEDKKETYMGGIDYLVPYFFTKIGVEKVPFLGQAWAYSINGYLDKYPINWDTPSGRDSSMDAKTVEQWILFGDPSLKIGGYNTV
jgi:hypothetical protein